MSIKLRPWSNVLAKPRFREALEDADWRRDNALVDELGFDSSSREWQVVASVNPFFAKYRNSSGQLYPFFDNESQLDNLRARCRVVGQVFPMAIAAVDALTNYTVGTGYKFQVQGRYGNVPQDFLARCDRVIDEFLERTNFSADLDRELFSTSRVDGESFAALWDLGDGTADIRIVQPEYVTEPNDPRAIENWLGDRRASDWRFGVRTAQYDTETVYGYYVQWSQEPGDFDYFPAENIEHIKLNVRRCTKRGLSDLHAVLAWLHRHDKLLRNTTIGAAIQASIAYIEQYADGTTQADAQAIALGGAAYTYDGAPGSSETRYATPHEPGQIVGLSPGMTYQAGPLGSERNPGFIAVVSAVSRLLGIRWAMPEYMISGDASNANLASTMIAESPWVKAEQARQAAFGKSQSNILYRVLGIALRDGRLDSMSIGTLEELRRAIKIVATAPQVEVRDKTVETQRRVVLMDKGIISRQTFAEEEGYDQDQETKRGAAPLQADPTAASIQAGLADQIVESMWKGYPGGSPQP